MSQAMKKNLSYSVTAERNLNKISFPYKSFYDVISSINEFFTNEIQALQHWWKKCVDYKKDYVEKLNSLNHIP